MYTIIMKPGRDEVVIGSGEHGMNKYRSWAAEQDGMQSVFDGGMLILCDAPPSPKKTGN